jgi:hypothetical protein
MAINVEALINNLGKTYQEIFDVGLIPYKTKPTGDSGCDYVSLDMIKEGVFLAFKRVDLSLFDVTLTLINAEKKSYIFPNELPSPLQKSMSRIWMHKTFGKPDNWILPRLIGAIQFGIKEKYTLEGFHIPVTMQVSYDLQEIVEEITFLPTSEVSW